MRTTRVLVLVLGLFSVFNFMDVIPGYAQEGSQFGAILLEKTDAIEMPQLNIGANWSYAYEGVPVIRENQSLNGSISSGLKSPGVNLCIKPFSATEILRASNQKNNLSCTGTSLELNLTEQANFSLPGLGQGLYTLSLSDTNSGQEISALQLLVAQEDLALQLPSSIKAGDPLKVEANISGINQSKIFGAIMISGQDYDSMSLNLTSRESGSGYNSTLKIGEREGQLPSLTNLSYDLAMDLLYLLPQNSAVAIQESLQSEVELFLITDTAWPKGEYILTCAVYSSKEGLLGLKQETVKVI